MIKQTAETAWLKKDFQLQMPTHGGATETAHNIVLTIAYVANLALCVCLRTESADDCVTQILFNFMLSVKYGFSRIRT